MPLIKYFYCCPNRYLFQPPFCWASAFETVFHPLAAKWFVALDGHSHCKTDLHSPLLWQPHHLKNPHRWYPAVLKWMSIRFLSINPYSFVTSGKSKFGNFLRFLLTVNVNAPQLFLHWTCVYLAHITTTIRFADLANLQSPCMRLFVVDGITRSVSNHSALKCQDSLIG